MSEPGERARGAFLRSLGLEETRHPWAESSPRDRQAWAAAEAEKSARIAELEAQLAKERAAADELEDASRHGGAPTQRMWRAFGALRKSREP